MTEEVTVMDDKIYYLIGLFDEVTNEQIQNIHRELSNHEVPSSSMCPHLTFGSWTNVDLNLLCHWLEEVCENQEEIQINFNHLGLFSLKVSFLAPYVSKQLIKFHDKIHERFEEYCGQMGYNYTAKSNNWVPHATLVLDEEEAVLRSLPVIAEAFVPFSGKITSLLLCEFGTFEEIKKFKLKQSMEV